MNIIAFIDWYTPGYKAGGITTAFANFVAYMKEHYTFYIITRNNDYTEITAYRGIEPDVWSKVSENEHVFYASPGFINSRDLKKIMKDITYDYIYINGIYSFWFSLFPTWYFRNKKHGVIINPHGMLSRHALAVKSGKKDFFVKLANIVGIYRNVTFHVADTHEANAVEDQIKKYKEIKVAFQFPRKIKTTYNKAIKKEAAKINLINIARIAPEKNTIYILETLKNCKEIIVRADLYGPVYNEDYWQKCKNIIAEMPAHVQVNYLGSLESIKVPGTMLNYHFMFMPSTGENFGHVILEAFQAGTPVIISDRTPWRSLQEKGVGWDIPLDQPEKFVRVIEYCAAMRQEEYNAMSQRAFEYAKKVTEDPEVTEANRRLFF